MLKFFKSILNQEFGRAFTHTKAQNFKFIGKILIIIFIVNFNDVDIKYLKKINLNF